MTSVSQNLMADDGSVAQRLSLSNFARERNAGHAAPYRFAQVVWSMRSVEGSPAFVQAAFVMANAYDTSRLIGMRKAASVMVNAYEISRVIKMRRTLLRFPHPHHVTKCDSPSIACADSWDSISYSTEHVGMCPQSWRLADEHLVERAGCAEAQVCWSFFIFSHDTASCGLELEKRYASHGQRVADESGA